MLDIPLSRYVCNSTTYVARARLLRLVVRLDTFQETANRDNASMDAHLKLTYHVRTTSDKGDPDVCVRERERLN